MRRSPKSPEGPTWSSHRAPLDALPGLCGRRLLARSRTAGSITSTTTSAERSTGVSSPEALSAGTPDLRVEFEPTRTTGHATRQGSPRATSSRAVCGRWTSHICSSWVSVIYRFYRYRPDSIVIQVVPCAGSTGAMTWWREGLAVGVLEGLGDEPVPALESAHQRRLPVSPLRFENDLPPRAQDDDRPWLMILVTEPEWQLLRCIVDGLTTDQMTNQLGVRRSTASTHVQNLLTDLGVYSRRRAAALMTAQASDKTWPVHMRTGVRGLRHLTWRARLS